LTESLVFPSLVKNVNIKIYRGISLSVILYELEGWLLKLMQKKKIE